jgi:HlyD family secretion protein
MKPNTKKIIIGLSVGFGLAATAFIVYAVTAFQTTEPESADEILVPVIVGTPRRETLERTVAYSGNLQPRRTVTVLSKVSGKVEQLHVAEGDVVLKDDLLVSMEDRVVRLQMDQAYSAWQAALAQTQNAEKGVRQQEVENAEALLEQARKDLELAKTNLERTERMFTAGAIPRNTYEQAENQVKSAETQVENATRNIDMMKQGAREEELDAARANAEAAKSQYELAKLQYENASVRAPSAGLVARIMIDEGNMVNNTVPLLAIVQIDPILARIAVPEKYYSRLIDRVGTGKVMIKPMAYPDDDPFEGTVTAVSPVIDAASRTFTVEAAIDNQKGLLKPGMYVDAGIVIDRSENTLTVPVTAVLERNGETVVFTVAGFEPAVVHMTPVETGISTGGRIEIVDGLSEDTRIVMEGNAFLEDGQSVHVTGMTGI